MNLNNLYIDIRVVFAPSEKRLNYIAVKRKSDNLALKGFLNKLIPDGIPCILLTILKSVNVICIDNVFDD